MGDETRTRMAAAEATGGCIDWSAVFAGAVVAAALSSVLLAFGAGVGFTLGAPEVEAGRSLAWVTIGAGLWFIAASLISYASGGYVAGRLRRPMPGATGDEVETRDGAQGLLVWAIGTVLAGLLAASGLGGAMGATASGLGAATATATGALEAAGPDLSLVASRLTRAPSGDGGGSGEVADVRDVARILTNAASHGDLPQEDRAFLADAVASRTALTADEAGARVDSAFAGAREIYEDAVAAADTARMSAAVAAFVIAASLMVAAALAYLSAVLGGRHRDANIPMRALHR